MPPTRRSPSSSAARCRRTGEGPRANPITYVKKDSPPFLIMHGDKDPMVPFGQSELFVAALKKAGADVTFRPVKGAGHGGPASGAGQSLGGRGFPQQASEGEKVDPGPSNPICAVWSNPLGAYLNCTYC